MMLLGPLGFAAPWLLLGLLALPVLWIVLRAVPPAPVRRLFPAVVLLMGLRDNEQVTDRTPWWLLLLRMLAVAAVIIGLAQPILNPNEQAETQSDVPLLVVMDATWASAVAWRQRLETLDGVLANAGRAERPVAIVQLSNAEAPVFQAADTWRSRLSGLQPKPWAAGPEMIESLIATLPDEEFDTYWMSDALARDSRVKLLRALQSKGTVSVFQTLGNLIVLEPPKVEDGAITLQARRLIAGDSETVLIKAQGADPAGNPALLAQASLTFEADDVVAQTDFELPAELRARITRFEIEGQRSAAAVALADDGLRQREVALIAGREGREGLELLSPLHYLHKAFEPTADILDGALLDILPANPDVIVLADVATVSLAEQQALLDWIEKGGLLLRFAGPRLAGSDVSRDAEDPLMPVRLRAGGRSVGGAMSWGSPKSLAPFDSDSPFFGLTVPEDVRVSAQVMAQPDPNLADRVIAQLSDGTPLVTRKMHGQGQVVLMHVTANAEWSSLPLSGLFVQMLERLAVSGSIEALTEVDLSGTVWQPIQVLDGFGRPGDADNLAGVAGERLFAERLGPDLQPGVYQGEQRSLARNVITAETVLEPVVWPSDIRVTGLADEKERPLSGLLLALAIALLLVDVIASLALSGKLRIAKAAALMLAGLIVLPQESRAQDDNFAIALTSEVRLAHVLTGDTQIDELAQAGLTGLSETLFFRTSVEPDDPIGVDLEQDELAFFPMLYWPIVPEQPTPSDQAYVKLNQYLRSGGMILFDTRDADIASFGAASPNGRKLRSLAAPLDIPPLEPIPEDHVLTRTFYLVQDFPGRHSAGSIWVEAAPPDAEMVDGMPFRNLNDNVTPVVIGGNDWASAWAMDQRGNPLVPIGRGFTGERQREIAYRFGVNLVMHVLTGNYKSDQVHVPALLERLGQ